VALKSFACPTPMTVDERLEEQEQEQEEEQLSDESDTMF